MNLPKPASSSSSSQRSSKRSTYLVFSGEVFTGTSDSQVWRTFSDQFL
jgi:hypothetical protein